MSQDVFDEWNHATGNKKLPERVTPKKPVTSLEALRAIGKRKK